MFLSLQQKVLAASMMCCAILPLGAAASNNPAKQPAAKTVQKVSRTTAASSEKTLKIESKGLFFQRLGQKLLWYFPDRGMDLCDCFTIEFGFGANIRTNLLLTRWLPIGAGAGPTVMIGWNGNREGGIYMLKGANADFAAFRSADQDQTWIMGNYKNLIDSGKQKPLYVQQYKDPLTIGFEGGCIGNGKFMIHLSSLADFIAGIFLIDFQNDDVVNQNN